MKALLLAKRNFKEILRDPLSLLFSLGFPAILLAVFRLINYNVGNSWMTMAELIPGVATFSLSFIMLYMTLLVSKDRTTAFLTRLYTTPLRASDFILGYTVPGVLLGVLQTLITYSVGLAVAILPEGGITVAGVETVSKTVQIGPTPVLTKTVEILHPWGIFTGTLAALPTILFFVALGILLGTLLGDRAAPGISSAIITASGLLGGAWMQLSLMGSFEKVCRFLPFYPATVLARTAFVGAPLNRDTLLLPLLVVVLYAMLALGGAIAILCQRMRD